MGVQRMYCHKASSQALTAEGWQQPRVSLASAATMNEKASGNAGFFTSAICAALPPTKLELDLSYQAKPT